MPTKELFRRLTLDEIYWPRVRSEKQPGEWEFPEQQIGEFETTLPTPTQAENDVLGTTAGAVVMLKQWDLSPVDLTSFDPAEPPGRPIGPPTNTVLPVIVVMTTLEVGGQLVCPNGTWTGSGITYTRQWASGGNAIGGATSNTYTIAASDVGNMILCRVTATNAGGALAVDTDPVGPATVARPTNTVAPAVTGTTVTGNILSCTNGTWTGSPTYALQWLRGAGNRPGSTTNTITLSAADEGNLMSCRVTATNAGGSTVQVSNAVGPITPTAASDEPGDEPAPQPTRPQRPRR
jgi:hypothetical protein